MRWSFPVGRIAGIELRLHVTFLLFVGWLAVYHGVVQRSPAHALFTVLFLLCVFGLVVLHELGHAFAARRYGIRTRDIVLLPIGGVAMLDRMPEKPAQELVVALAGPAVNVLLAPLLFVAVLIVEPGFQNGFGFGGRLLASLFAIDILLVLFNLIPAFPMDGGRVVRALLAMRMPFAQATRLASLLGQALALGFSLWALMSQNYMYLFVALFVFLAAGEERAMVEAGEPLAGLPVRDAMLTDFRVVDAADPLRRAIEHLMAGSQQDFPVLEHGLIVGVLTRADLVRALQEGGADRRVGDFVRRSNLVAGAHEPLEAAVRRMREHALGALPVVDQDRLVGVLTLENIGDLLSVRAALRRYAAQGPADAAR